jgi:hypothetical protein
MPLYEFVLEIQNGDTCYEHKDLVVAPHDELAMRYAREYALHWHMHVQHDQQNDIYTAPEGWPQWSLARCTPITHVTVPIAGKKRTARFTPILWDDAFPDGLRRAAEILRALADPSLAGCSLQWVLADHLALSGRDLADIVRAVILLQQSVPDSIPIPAKQEMKVAA